MPWLCVTRRRGQETGPSGVADGLLKDAPEKSPIVGGSCGICSGMVPSCQTMSGFLGVDEYRSTGTRGACPGSIFVLFIFFFVE